MKIIDALLVARALNLMVAGCLLFPSVVEAQQRVSLEGRAGVALPKGRLARLTGPGPNVGMQLAYPMSERLALSLDGDVDMLRGSRLSVGKAPNLTLLRYGAGIRASLLPQRDGANPWSLMADLGLGAATFDTENFSLPDEASQRDFTETYFASGAGLRLGYQMSSRVSTHLGARAHWMSTDATDTQVLQSLDPSRVQQFSSAWSMPVTVGFSIRTGASSAEQRAAAPERPETASRQVATRRRSDDGRAAHMATLQERVHFDFDRFEIKPEFALVLERKAEILREFPDIRILIEGHCDEWGSVEYNQALGHRRATAVMDHLTKLGVSAERMQTTSYGKERPVSMERTERAWNLNRRAEFVVESLAAVSFRTR